MKLLFQFEFQHEQKQEQIMSVKEEQNCTDADMEYINDIVNGVNNNIQDLDKKIEKHAKGWSISRISKVDLAILRLGIYEIEFRGDIPYSVSVNEAVELAKKYSSKESGAFINGILASIANQMGVGR